MVRVLPHPFSSRSKPWIREVVTRNGILVFPTETYYALGCSALSSEAAKKVYRLKARSREQPLLILIHSWEMLHEYFDPVSDSRLRILKRYWPAPLTAILKANGKLADELNFQSDEVAVRMTPHPVARELISLCGVPLVGTSANRSNCPPSTELNNAIRAFPSGIDLFIEGGRTLGGAPSTIIRFLKDDTIQLVRQGAAPLD